MSDRPYEVIQSSRRYVLGETLDGYGIWDRLAGPEPVEEFPPTDEGIDLALSRFAELKWRDRRERWDLPRLVGAARWTAIAAGIGALIWLIAGTGETVIFSFDLQLGGAGTWLPRLLLAMDSFGYRLAIGSLVLLGVLVLIRWLQPIEDRVTTLASSLQELAPGRRLELAVRIVLLVGLVVWIVSAIATEAIFRLELEPFAETRSRPAIAFHSSRSLRFAPGVQASSF